MAPVPSRCRRTAGLAAALLTGLAALGGIAGPLTAAAEPSPPAVPSPPAAGASSAAAPAAGATGSAPAAIFPLSEVRAGLTAVARTVFAGEQVEEFKVEILGVYEDFAGPDLDVILARLVGERVEHTGVVAGMSGSPVYVDGRLMGALSYRIGSFPKDPIAGITPIEKMLPLLGMPAGDRGARRPVLVDPLRWSLPLLPEDALAVVDFLPPEAPAPAGGYDRAADSAGMPAIWPAPGSAPAQALRPIDTPLVFSGLDPAVLAAYSTPLRALGLLPVQGGAAGRLPAGEPRPTRFEPGSAIAAQLARGDVEISATGTVTYLSGREVLAFGHPFLRSGFTAIPFAPARVLMTVASLSDSFKLAAPGDSVGLLRQDRLTAVAGRLGEPAEMIPIRLSIRTAGAPSRDLAFEVFDDPVWSPLVIEIATTGSLVNAIDFSLPATVDLRASLRFEGHPEVRLQNIFSGSGAPLNVQQTAIRYVTSVFSLLYANRFETPRVRGLDFEIEQRPERLYTVVEDLWLSRTEALPGDALTVRVFLRPYRGERVHRDFDLQVPAGLSAGPLSVLVGSGQAFQRRDQRLTQLRLAQSESLDQMIQVIGGLPRYDGLYLRLVRRSEGGVLRQRLAPALPPSVLEVLRSSETSGDFAPHNEEVLVEKRITLDGAVFGARQAELRVKGDSS